MSISLSNYIDITSGLGAGTVVGTRNLGSRIFTTNTLLPTQSYKEFTTLASVGTYFGTTSTEYEMASFYFSWISKNITSPQVLSFARWTDVAQAPMIFGANLTNIGTTLSTFTAISNGAFALTLGATTHQVTGLNFSTDVSLAAVATTIQTAINAFTGTQWSAATVTYNATTNNFDFVGGDSTSPDAISVAAPLPGPTDISGLMGWRNTGSWPNAPIFSNGSAAETITETLTNSTNLSTNFGTFLFIPTFTQAQMVEATTWSNGQNVTYIYCAPVSAANAQAWSTAIESIAGASLTLSPTTSPQEYPEMFPGMILAATDYSAANSVQNYMFQQANLTPSVTTDADAALYDSLNINYYGQTQTAGQKIAFYQRGLMSGSGVTTNPALLNIYANEIWLKDAIGAAIMTLLLAKSKVSANAQGAAQILAIIQSVINQALNNGTISVGGVISTTQQLYISEITNDPNAWRQVQNSGYWVNVVMEAIPDTNPVQYQAVYTMVYKKDDDVNELVGKHVLI